MAALAPAPAEFAAAPPAAVNPGVAASGVAALTSAAVDEPGAGTGVGTGSAEEAYMASSRTDPLVPPGAPATAITVRALAAANDVDM